MKNVSIWCQQKPIAQLSIFCLIQGINLASNILLLASKKCFLTSQG